MKALEIIKRIVTIITLILLTLDLFTHFDVLPYALLGLCTFEFIKGKEFYDVKDNKMCAFSITAGIIAFLSFIYIFLVRR